MAIKDMAIDELLWRTFQSKFAKKLNKLPKKEQKKYFKIFSFRRKINNVFEFNKISQLFFNIIKEKKEESKRSRLLRKLIGQKEAQNQKEILQNSARILADEVFENKNMALVDIERLILISKKELEGKSRGCEFYPCEPKKTN